VRILIVSSRHTSEGGRSREAIHQKRCVIFWILCSSSRRLLVLADRGGRSDPQARNELVGLLSPRIGHQDGGYFFIKVEGMKLLMDSSFWASQSPLTPLENRTLRGNKKKTQHFLFMQRPDFLWRTLTLLWGFLIVPAGLS